MDADCLYSALVICTNEQRDEGLTHEFVVRLHIGRDNVRESKMSQSDH